MFGQWNFGKNKLFEGPSISVKFNVNYQVILEQGMIDYCLTD
jgi:hypothetical protein